MSLKINYTVPVSKNVRHMVNLWRIVKNSSKMASEVPDEFNLFGTPLTESDFIINENKLVINENVDYSVMVKGETMDFTPCDVENPEERVLHWSLGRRYLLQGHDEFR